MKPWSYGVVGIAVLNTLWFSDLSCAAEDDPDRPGNPMAIAQRCAGMYGSGACTAYGGRNGATVYAQPNAGARVLERWKYGEWMGLLKPASKLGNAEWIPIYIAVEGPKGPHTRVIAAYVRRADVILDTDFRRVTGCWPVKYLKDPQGGYDYYPGAVYFTMQGIGSYPHHPVSVVEYGEQHTYYADGVFTVRHEKYSDRHLYGQGVLDYAKHTVLHAGTMPLKEGEQLQWFSSEEMKDCKQVPTVDPHFRAPNPNAFKRH